MLILATIFRSSFKMFSNIGSINQGAAEVNLPENARGAKAITQFAADSGEETAYKLNPSCYFFLANVVDGPVAPLQSPNNPVLLFEAGAEDGDYGLTMCLVDRATYQLSCGPSTDNPATDWACSYTFSQDGTTNFYNYVWYLGGTPSASNCQTFTNTAVVIAD